MYNVHANSAGKGNWINAFRPSIARFQLIEIEDNQKRLSKLFQWIVSKENQSRRFIFYDSSGHIEGCFSIQSDLNA